MEDDKELEIKKGDREKIIGELLGIISASFIFSEILLYTYYNLAWEINLVCAIFMLIGGFIGFSNVRIGGILLIMVGLILLIFGLLFYFTSITAFFTYSPLPFFREIGVSFEGFLGVVGGILIIDSGRKK